MLLRKCITDLDYPIFAAVLTEDPRHLDNAFGRPMVGDQVDGVADSLDFAGRGAVGDELECVVESFDFAGGGAVGDELECVVESFDFAGGAGRR